MLSSPLSHLILGLLRDGTPRHGYDLISKYRDLSGSAANPGNFYRELRGLVDGKYLTPESVAPGEDQRRIPYRITELGRTEFDRWLCAPITPQEELSSWLLFADRVPASLLTDLLEATREQLWLQGKTLEHARATLLSRNRRDGTTYDPASHLILWQIKRVTADLEFLVEFRREIDSVLLSRNGGSTGGPEK
jgi:DNA-binding PadR family transcriptional regulator